MIRTYKIKINNEIPTAPTITGGNSSWVATAQTISVQTDGIAISGVKHYEYYKSIDNIEPTDLTEATGITENEIAISDEGTTYIWYRTVSNNDFKSKWSKPQIVKLDTSEPTITINSNLPTSITKGDSYEILETLTANGPSGVIHFCESNPDGIISNTSELTTLGIHKIYCTASTGAGVNKVVEKTITLTYQGYNAKNIIENGSFENGTTGWNIPTYYGTFESSTDFATTGSHSLKINPLSNIYESIVYANEKITYIKGHKYYATADSYVPENGGSRAAQIYLVDSNYQITNYIAYSMAYKGKNKISFYLDEPTWETTTTMNFRIDNDNDYSNTATYMDSIMLIDLTEAFGAGNEPDKEWCDKHINYFDGTTTIYK